MVRRCDWCRSPTIHGSRSRASSRFSAASMSRCHFCWTCFGFPSDTFQLFLATGVINSRFGTLLAAVHTLAVALLGTCAMVGVLRWHPGRMLRYLVTTAIVVGVVLGGGGSCLELFSHRNIARIRCWLRCTCSGNRPTRWSIAPRPAWTNSPPTGPTLTAIRARGSLRVGYLPDSLPYAFFNERDDLVGFDVELAHRLASELRVGWNSCLSREPHWLSSWRPVDATC